jgi:peptidoglycan/LPS O-acetylase OafA/YrhL
MTALEATSGITRVEPRATPRAAGPDLMRALAILLVMLFHLPLAAVPASLAGVKPYGWLGVDIFFVLSGYLIGQQVMRPPALGGPPRLADFYLRRAFRILPAFLTVLVLYVALPMIREAPTLAAPWRFLTFTVNVGLDNRATRAFTQAWSLCVEEHFYLVLPLLVPALGRLRSPRPALALAAAIIAGGAALRAALWLAFVKPRLAAGQLDGLTSVYLQWVYYPTWCHLDGLTAGVLIAAARRFRSEAWRRLVPPQRALPTGLLLVACGLLLVGHRGSVAQLPIVMQSLPGAVLGFPVFAAGCALVLSALLDLERSPWRLPGVGAVATLSYSLYLTHKAVMHADRLWLGDDALTGATGLATYLVTCLAAATLLWAAVERPFLRLRQRWLA